MAPSCHSSIPVGTFRSPPDTIIITQAEERMQYFFEDFTINVSGSVDKNYLYTKDLTKMLGCGIMTISGRAHPRSAS